ncbi:MAG: DUF4277 domain-containing protein [Acidimicrobiales bacterium]
MGVSAPSTTPVLVNPRQLRVAHATIGGLPVVNSVLSRLGFDELVASFMEEPGPRCSIEPGRAIGVLVRNLCLGREPLYGLGHWAGGVDPCLLGLSAKEAAALSDDCVGRALDRFFAADRASLLTALSLRAIDAYAIELSELHDDSTSIALYGAYRDATGEARCGKTPPRPAWGHSKTFRPDLLTELPGILSLVKGSQSGGGWVRVPAHGHCRRRCAPGSRLADGHAGGVVDRDRRPIRSLSAA